MLGNGYHDAWILVFPCTKPSCSIKYYIIDIHDWSCWHISCNNANPRAIKCISKFSIASPLNHLAVAKWSHEIHLTPVISPFRHNMKRRGHNNVCNTLWVQGSNGKKYNSMGIILCMLSCTWNDHNWDFQYIKLSFNLLPILSIRWIFPTSTPNVYPKCK